MDDAQIQKIGETIYGRSNVPRYYSRDYLNQLPLRLFIFGFGYSTIALIIGGVFGVVVISVYELLDPGKFGAWSYAMATLWALIVVWKMMTLNSHPVAFSVFTAIVLTASIIPFIFRWTGLL